MIKGKLVLVCGRVIIIKKAIALYDKRIPMNLITQTLLVINNAHCSQRVVRYSKLNITLQLLSAQYSAAQKSHADKKIRPRRR